MHRPLGQGSASSGARASEQTPGSINAINHLGYPGMWYLGMLPGTHIHAYLGNVQYLEIRCHLLSSSMIQKKGKAIKDSPRPDSPDPTN